MITFGVILGKCSLQQLLCLVWLEMIFYALNEAICVNVFKVTDAGGSILVHTFGAYFGIGASYFFQSGRAAVSKNLVSSYQSEMIAVVGSIFLWMYWPSFNQLSLPEFNNKESLSTLFWLSVLAALEVPSLPDSCLESLKWRFF